MFRFSTVLLLLSVVFPATTTAQQFVSFYGTATDVYDADVFTIRLSDLSRAYLDRWLSPAERRTGTVGIQLQGIDTPERSANHPYWQESRAHLVKLLRGQKVNIQVLLGPSGNLNRSPAGFVGVARVGRFAKPLNLSLIEAGLAKDDWRVSFGLPYVNAQQIAMSRRVGIWSDSRQYAAENDFRIRLYGTGRAKNEGTLVRYPDGKVTAAGKPETFVRKSPFPNKGVGKAEWQKGVDGKQRRANP